MECLRKSRRKVVKRVKILVCFSFSVFFLLYRSAKKSFYKSLPPKPDDTAQHFRLYGRTDERSQYPWLTWEKDTSIPDPLSPARFSFLKGNRSRGTSQILKWHGSVAICCKRGGLLPPDVRNGIVQAWDTVGEKTHAT